MTTERIYCLRCKKPVGNSSFMVQFSTDGRMWADQFAPFETLGEKDQGWFEVGGDCYRRVMAAGTAGLLLEGPDR